MFGDQLIRMAAMVVLCILLCSWQLQAGELECDLQPFDLHFRDAELTDILQTLAVTSGVNIIWDRSVEGRLTVDLREVSLTEAVDLITKMTDYDYRWINDVLFVGSGPEFEPDPEPAPSPETEVFRLKYGEVEKIGEILTALFPELAVEFDQRRHLLIVQGTPDRLLEIGELIEELDRPRRQVLIQVEAVTMSHEEVLEVGTRSDPGLIVDKLRDGLLFTADLIDVREGTADTRILARPSLLTLDGQPAELLIGERVPHRIEKREDGEITTHIEYFEAGVSLKIVPRIIESREVLLNIRPEVSTFEWREGFELPQISTRELETVLRLRCGETVGLGGLIRDEERKTARRLPYFGELPILDLLFGRREEEEIRSELYVFITPHIVEGTLSDRGDTPGLFPEQEKREEGDSITSTESRGMDGERSAVPALFFLFGLLLLNSF